MHDVRFFRVDKFNYEAGEEDWLVKIQTDFVPRVGDYVAVFPDEDSLEVLDVKLYYAVEEEGQEYIPVIEVYLLSEDAE